MGLRIIHPRQKYFYCFISMETCWKGFKIITVPRLVDYFETQLFFENNGYGTNNFKVYLFLVSGAYF